MKKTDVLVASIYNEVKSSEVGNNYSLMNGVLGEALFLSHYYLAYKQEETRNLIIERVDAATEAINSTSQIDYTLCDGLSGYVWLLDYLLRKEILPSQKLAEVEEINAFVSNHVINELAFSIDYLYGTTGFAHSLVNQQQLNPQLVNQLVNLFEDNVVESETQRYWMEEDELNMGMAHGQIAILSFYLKAYTRTKEKSLLVAIEKHFNFLYGYLDFSMSNYSFSPDTLKDATCRSSYTTRMGWCYGDLPYLFMLLKASEVLGLKTENITLKKMLKLTFERTELSKYSVIDTIFCHGFSGLIAMGNFIKTSSYTSSENYAYTAWINEYQDHLKEQDTTFNFIHEHPIKGTVSCDNGLLEGKAGIGLTLLAEMNPKHLSFLEFFGW